VSQEYAPESFWDERVRSLGDLGDGYANRNLQNYEDRVRMRKAFGILGDVSGLRILDVGCGTGRWSIRLAKMGGIVTGIDISQEMIELAKQRANESQTHNITFLSKNADGLNYSGNFDVALTATVLQHITDKKRLNLAVRGIVNAVKEDGRILIIESAPLTRDKEAVPEKRVKFVELRTKQEWIDLFQGYGTKFVKSREVCLLVPRSPKLYTRFGNKITGKVLERLAEIVDGHLAEWWYLRKYAKPTIFLFEKK